MDPANFEVAASGRSVASEVPPCVGRTGRASSSSEMRCGDFSRSGSAAGQEDVGLEVIEFHDDLDVLEFVEAVEFEGANGGFEVVGFFEGAGPGAGALDVFPCHFVLQEYFQCTLSGWSLCLHMPDLSKP